MCAHMQVLMWRLTSSQHVYVLSLDISPFEASLPIFCSSLATKLYSCVRYFNGVVFQRSVSPCFQIHRHNNDSNCLSAKLMFQIHH